MNQNNLNHNFPPNQSNNSLNPGINSGFSSNTQSRQYNQSQSDSSPQDNNNYIPNPKNSYNNYISNENQNYSSEVNKNYDSNQNNYTSNESSNYVFPGNQQYIAGRGGYSQLNGSLNDSRQGNLQRTKKRGLGLVSFILITITLSLIGALMLGGLALFFLLGTGDSLKEVGPIKQKVSPDISQYQDNSDSVDGIVVIDLEDSSVGFTEPRQVKVSELELAHLVLTESKAKGWKGGYSDYKMTFEDIPQEKIDSWLQREEERSEGLTIRDELEGLYIQDQGEIKDETLNIYDEYILYLKSKNVDQKYLEEIEYILPKDLNRFDFNFSKDPDTPTFVEPYIDSAGEKDYSRAQMSLSGVDFHNGARVLRESGIIGKSQTEPYKDLSKERTLRNMSMRYYIYHEMTHILQKAYINIQLGRENVDSNNPFQTAEDSTMMASKQYLWKWGEDSITSRSALPHNNDIAFESQAEGVAFDALMTKYKLTETQRELIWEHQFGRLEEARKLIEEMQAIFETNYPNYSPSSFWRYVGSSIERGDGDKETKRGLSIINDRLLLAPYIGYSHPTAPQELSEFWILFKN